MDNAKLNTTRFVLCRITRRRIFLETSNSTRTCATLYSGRPRYGCFTCAHKRRRGRSWRRRRSSAEPVSEYRFDLEQPGRSRAAVQRPGLLWDHRRVILHEDDESDSRYGDGGGGCCF